MTPVAVLGEKSTVLVVLVPTSRGELEDLVRVVAARFGLCWRHQGRQNNRLASLHRDEGVSGSCSVNALLRAASTYLPLDGPRVNAMVGTARNSLALLSEPDYTTCPHRRLQRVSRRPPRAPESIAGTT